MTARRMEARRGETRSGSTAQPRQPGPQDAHRVCYPTHTQEREMSETIAVGQIWREVDPRFNRYVRVESVGTMLGTTHIVGIRTVVPDENGGWDRPLGSRYGRANAVRFNGKRGNYEFVAPATPASAS